jgi:hypothetical protein
MGFYLDQKSRRKMALGPLGYECNHQRCLMNLRGAKSNVTSSKRSWSKSQLPLRCPSEVNQTSLFFQCEFRRSLNLWLVRKAVFGQKVGQNQANECNDSITIRLPGPSRLWRRKPTKGLGRKGAEHADYRL